MLIQYTSTCLATRASRALKGSSNMYTSELEYTALAIEILCFWPPLIFTPRSPISVRSRPFKVKKNTVMLSQLLAFHLIEQC